MGPNESSKPLTVEIAGETFKLSPMTNSEVIDAKILSMKFNVLQSEGRPLGAAIAGVTRAVTEIITASINRANPGVHVDSDFVGKNLLCTEAVDALARLAAVYLDGQNQSAPN